ncbi:apolipoprotein N-acyltransferase [Thermodesulfobacteriota bacterium]
MTRSIPAAAAGGFLLSLSFPLAGLDTVAWIGLIPFLWALDRSSSFAGYALCGLVFGSVFFLFNVYWLHATLLMHGNMGPLAAYLLFSALILSLSLFTAFFAILVKFFNDRGFDPLVPAPFLWVSMEYARSVAFTGFPWDLLGYSQSERLIVVQVADLTGIYGISFLVVIVNVALWGLLRGKITGVPVSWKFPAVAAVLLLMVLGYGKLRLDDFPRGEHRSNGFPIGVLQPNIPQEIKWKKWARSSTLRTFEQLGREAVRRGARLLIWPETSVTVVIGSGDTAWKEAAEISVRLGVPLLVGAPSLRVEEGEARYYNSAFVMNGALASRCYDKIHLVPFGEYMPLTWLLPLAQGIAARESDFSPGATMTVIQLGDCPPFSVLICYEAIFPGLARQAIRNGARMLVNITNDAWFGASGAPYQHLAMARIRSIENRVRLVRCANTGISAVFDRAGRMIKGIPLGSKGLFLTAAPLGEDVGSFYCRNGDVFAWGCIGVLGICGLSALKGKPEEPQVAKLNV